MSPLKSALTKAFGSIAGSLVFILPFYGVMLHLSTVYIALENKGGVAGLVTLILPFVSDVFWLIWLGIKYGFINYYTLAISLWVVISAFMPMFSTTRARNTGVIVTVAQFYIQATASKTRSMVFFTLLLWALIDAWMTAKNIATSPAMVAFMFFARFFLLLLPIGCIVIAWDLAAHWWKNDR